MTHQEIIDSIKVQYNRDLRKQLVKNLQEYEKMQNKQGIKSGYQIMNQIFSYVLAQLGWNVSDNALNWDESPLQILEQSFPHIEETEWFQGLQLNLRKSIEVRNQANA